MFQFKNCNWKSFAYATHLTFKNPQTNRNHFAWIQYADLRTFHVISIFTFCLIFGLRWKFVSYLVSRFQLGLKCLHTSVGLCVWVDFPFFQLNIAQLHTHTDLESHVLGGGRRNVNKMDSGKSVSQIYVLLLRISCTLKCYFSQWGEH